MPRKFSFRILKFEIVGAKIVRTGKASREQLKHMTGSYRLCHHEMGASSMYELDEDPNYPDTNSLELTV